MNGLPEAMKCSHQQKELLSRICAPGACANTLPTYSVHWQLSSIVTSFDRLAYTWQAVASHHVVLRTSIILTDGSFDLDVRKRASQIQIRSTKADLSVRGELDTAELAVYVGERVTYLCLRVHYALVDRPSLAHVRHDFDLFYDGFACEPYNPFKYYVRHINDRDPQRALSYWRQKMSGVVTSLTYGIPRGRQGKRQTCARCLDLWLVQDIYHFCEAFGVLVHEFFYATWALIQYRHTAATDGVVVFAVRGRDDTVPEYDTYVGLTEQLYPIKLQIKAGLSALDWIMQVCDVDRESASNAFIGYEHIQREILPLEVQVQLLVGDGLDIVEEGIDDTQLPLVVNFDHKNGSVTMTYDSDRDENASLVVLIDHLITAMQSIIADPRTPIEQVEITSKHEKELLTACSEPLTGLVPGFVHKLVERQAEITPEREAVNFEGLKSMTYDKLNKLSNQVARQLPCKRGDNVPVCMDRTPNLIIALLAILKTGAAYVLLDPESPSDRCDYIVSDVQASLVLTDEVSETKFANSLAIDHLIESASRFEATNLLVHQEPSDVVYIIYTSGSTGRPKGVILEHTAAFTGLDAFPLLPDLRQLLFHNPVFSAAQRSIWSTLKQGGCLCLARKEHLTSQITEMINRMRVNVIDVTPSTASLINPNGVPTLRRMTVAGELINPALLPIWMDRLELLNAYGLSEVTQINWRHHLHPGQNPQNIGRPVDSTRSYVLLPGTMRQASILEPGELCLSGHQLARGYLNRPKKSEQSFIRNPFGPGRLYRTGDMVVAHPDGSIEMIGRIDFQIKINGQRVEPGEINYYLQKHHDVFDSCTVSTTIAGKKSLVAVVVPKNQQNWPSLSRKLQLLLRQRLPPYMVPSYWLPVPELPLNINGKVDVPSVAKLAKDTPREKMLTRSLSSRDGSESAFLTAAQQSMRTIWSEVLAIAETEISLDDSFLGLGGTSLEAIMAVSSARARLIDVKAHDILLHDSLRDVVKASRGMASPLKQVFLPPFCFVSGTLQVERSLLEDAWPVTPSQEPLIADLVLGGTQYIYNRILSPRTWSSTTVKAAFASLLNRIPFLRSTFVEHGSTYLQLVHKHMSLPWEVASETLQEYIDSRKSPKLVLGQPFCRILEMKSGELIITFHHALFDYWSGDFFYEDMAALINQQPLIERPFYNQYVNFIREQNQSKTHKFWRDYLQGATETKIETLQHKESEIVVCSDSLDLHLISKDIGIPVGSLLYAAWAIVLSSETGLKDLIFGATFSGRDIPVPNILSMYGPTVTNALLRIQIRDNFSLRDVAKAVQYEVSRVSEHVYCGLRTILRAAGHSSALFNTTVNFLFRQSSVSQSEMELLHSFSPPVSDHVKFEVDSRHIERLSLTSPLDSSMSRSVLNKLTTVFKCFEAKAETPIIDVMFQLRPENISSMSSQNLNELQGCLAHSLFERRAITHSSKVAVTNEYGQSLTYEQLNQKANQLAVYLRGKGIRPETIVPLYLEKSLNTLISMFGIWKAGGAFCALDPANSVERNMLILSEVRASLVITDKENASGLANSGIEDCILDQLDLNSIDPGKFSPSELTPQNLAYVLYTSGSTGRPKGVLITHEAVAAASHGMIKAAAITEQWRSLWALNYVFDGSYFDVFPLLGAGGTLCLARQQQVFMDLAGYINRLRVTHLNITPTIAKTITPDEVPNLKVLVVGGEPLHSGIRDTWASRMTVYNNYGPTEGMHSMITR